MTFSDFYELFSNYTETVCSCKKESEPSDRPGEFKELISLRNASSRTRVQEVGKLSASAPDSELLMNISLH